MSLPHESEGITLTREELARITASGLFVAMVLSPLVEREIGPLASCPHGSMVSQALADALRILADVIPGEGPATICEKLGMDDLIEQYGQQQAMQIRPDGTAAFLHPHIKDDVPEELQSHADLFEFATNAYFATHGNDDGPAGYL